MKFMEAKKGERLKKKKKERERGLQSLRLEFAIFNE